MADDLNSLLQANRASSVMEGIANPPLVNPLAAMNSGMATASAMYQLRGQQAQAGWGDALQQATDPVTGVVNYPKAQAIAAGMGVRTQQGMLSNLTGTSNLSGQQLEQSDARRIRFARNQMSLIYDSSDANVRKIAADEIAAGTPAEVANQQMNMWLAIPEVQRRHKAYAQGLTAMDVGTSAGRTMGDTKPIDVGGEVRAPTITQPTPEGPGTIVSSPGALPRSLSPEKLMEVAYTRAATSADVDAARANGIEIAPGSEIRFTNADIAGTGKYSFLLTPAQRAALQAPKSTTITRSGQPASNTNPPRVPRQVNVPQAAPTPTAPPAVMPTTAPPGFGGGAPPVPVAPAPAPVAPPAARPPAGRPTVPTGASLAPDGSVQVASANPLDAPVTGPPAESSPLVPGDVAAIQQGMAGAAGARLPGTQTAQIYTQGPGYDEQVVAAQSKERLAAGLKAGSDYAKSIFPIAQALKQYGRGVTTAPGAAEANQFKGWINGVSRSMGGPQILPGTADFDKLAKDLNQVLMSNAGAGRSDASLSAVLAGNANTHIHEMAGEDVMKANGALVRATALASSAWQKMLPDERAKYGHYFANYENDFNKTFDLRAGAYDMYNPAQKKSLVEDLRKAGPAAQKRFWDSVDLLESNGYLNDTRAMP